MDLRLISPPLTMAEKLAVIPIADVKAQARVSHNDEDALIESYIEAAFDFLSGPDGWLGRFCLLEQEWEYYAPSSARGYIELPMRPVPFESDLTFEYLTPPDSYGAVDASLYGLVTPTTFARINQLALSTWPYYGSYNSRAYRVTFVAGYGLATDVPRPIKMAIQILAARMYENRDM